MKWIFVFALILLTNSCNKDDSRMVVASVNGEKIFLNEIDNSIQNSLYEFLFAIFRIRKIAVEEIIDGRIISKEALKQKVSVDSLLAIGISDLEKKVSKAQYIKNNSLEKGVMDERNPFNLIALNTDKGKEILDNSYRAYLRQEYLKILRIKYQVEIELNPPVTPKLEMEGVEFRSRGNVKANHSVWIISDFTCSACQNFKPVLRGVYDLYKDKLHFKYVHLASEINPSIKFAECAGKQGQYWQSYDMLFGQNCIDTLSTEKLISGLKLDRKLCLNCMKESNDTLRLIRSMARLKDLDISVTPSILVDDRVYHGEITRKAISEYLDRVINRD